MNLWLLRKWGSLESLIFISRKRACVRFKEPWASAQG
jgi:hypothetical protein